MSKEHAEDQVYSHPGHHAAGLAYAGKMPMREQSTLGMMDAFLGTVSAHFRALSGLTTSLSEWG